MQKSFFDDDCHGSQDQIKYMTDSRLKMQLLFILVYRNDHHVQVYRRMVYLKSNAKIVLF